MTDRPAWVERVNRGEIWPISEAAAAPFTVDGLAGQVAASMGVEPAAVLGWVGEESIEPLAVLVGALEGEARLTVLGRWITHRFLGRLIAQRVAVERYVAGDPGVGDEPIDAPWFVTGAPRSGTTVLHAVLAADPRNRVPRGWELLHPAPPPDPADPDQIATRIRLADVELRTPQVVAPGLGDIHDYSGEMPKECLSAMSLAFRSEEFIARYDVPSYVSWLQRCDMRPAYEMHRRVLQVLQRRRPTARWVLKSPVHLHSLATLLDVYPDARVSFTHRDPLAVLGSVSSLVATMRSVHSDHVDAEGIGRYHAELYGVSLDGLVDSVDGTAGRPALLDPARTTHTRHDDFLADPLTALGAIYDRLGWDLPPGVAGAQAAAIRSQTQAAPGTHRYALADYGIAPDQERRRLGRYLDRFVGGGAP